MKFITRDGSDPFLDPALVNQCRDEHKILAAVWISLPDCEHPVKFWCSFSCRPEIGDLIQTDDFSTCVVRKIFFRVRTSQRGIDATLNLDLVPYSESGGE